MTTKKQLKTAAKRIDEAVNHIEEARRLLSLVTVGQFPDPRDEGRWKSALARTEKALGLETQWLSHEATVMLGRTERKP